MVEINLHRKDIDIIDDQIMDLLDKRFTLSGKIGTLKNQVKKQVLDANREQKILEKTLKYSHSPEIGEVYKYIMEVSKNLQRK